MFFSGRRKIDRIAEVVRSLVEGQKPPLVRIDQEPYRSLLTDINSLASRLEQGSQTSVEDKNRILAILESMTEGVLVVDTEQKILLVNSALCRAFGFEKELALGRFSWEMFRDPDINEMIQAGLKQRRASRREHDALLSDLVFEIQVSPVFTSLPARAEGAGDDFTGVVAVFRDITSLKEFDRLRSEFVANVSHELKTPLTSILGFVETLKEGAVEDAEHRMKFLTIIEQQSKKLHALIEDLLLLSRLESAKDPLRLEEVDLAEMLERVEETFAPILKEKKIAMKVDIGAGKSGVTRVRAEKSSLERAVCNLVDNAVKYNVKNGSIAVHVLRGADGVSIAVSDTGIGIAAQDLPRLFERFYRIDKSRSRESGGSGLGLSIAKHIVERHGGRIEVESAVQKGSTFTLILPLY